MNYQNLLDQKIKEVKSQKIQKVTLNTENMLYKEEKKIEMVKKLRHERKEK